MQGWLVILSCTNPSHLYGSHLSGATKGRLSLGFYLESVRGMKCDVENNKVGKFVRGQIAAGISTECQKGWLSSSRLSHLVYNHWEYSSYSESRETFLPLATEIRSYNLPFSIFCLLPNLWLTFVEQWIPALQQYITHSFVHLTHLCLTFPHTKLLGTTHASPTMVKLDLSSNSTVKKVTRVWLKCQK